MLLFWICLLPGVLAANSEPLSVSEHVVVDLLGIVEALLEGLWTGIFPGTKWCGAGHTAKHSDDLGFFSKTDKCCQIHDSCNDTISKETGPRYGFPVGKLTKLNCHCEMAFLDCLKETKDGAGYLISVIYFNIVGRKCFKYDYPATCTDDEGLLGKIRRRCVKYEYDESKLMIWDWYDIPRVIKRPLFW